MKKKELSPIELKKVVELRHLGARWTEIENETKVERRAAKRAYEEWERDKIMKEQEAVRFRIAAEAFHEHLNDLIKLAEALRNHLSLPSESYDTRSAEQHLSNLWYTNILEELKPYALSQADYNRQKRSTERVNLIIFKSLQDHTNEKVPWQALEEWKKAWGNCGSIFSMLRPEVQEVATAFLHEEKNALEIITKQTEEELAVKWMARTVLDALWRSVLDGKFNPECPDVALAYNLVGGQSSYITSSKEEPRFTLKEWNTALTSACQTVAKILFDNQIELFKQLHDEVQKARKAIDELANMLNRHKLYPLILYTRCELCPT
ncbi:MAG: hypothetical protein A2Z29_09520 [Chloroflexi bacterium RBG_16_56_11]|nr:MAG: hypothetical protein A2Z29_09520 [Chloroflexi bacterium RBG_16_56_11]